MAHPDSTFTRRGFVAGAGAIVVAPAIPRRSEAQPPRIRRRVVGADADATMLEAYKRAIRAMLQLPPSDPRNWYRQAIVHMIDCPHGNWWFLPWHRGYLRHFEQICAQLSGLDSFALPFWDWTAGPRVPASFFSDVLDPRNPAYLPDFNTLRTRFRPALVSFRAGLSQAARNDLGTRGFATTDALLNAIRPAFPARASARTRTPQAPSFPARFAAAVAIGQVRAALVPTRFEDFGSDRVQQHSGSAAEDPLESGPHNNVHGAVGGFMGDFMSPVDPLFWLHHANIDRLWSLWTRRERAAGRSGRPTANLNAWLNEPFRFFCDRNGQPLPAAKAGDYVDEAALGYSYGPGSADDILAAPVAVAMAAEGADAARPAAERERRTLGSSTGRASLRAPAQASLTVSLPAGVLDAAVPPAGAAFDRSPTAAAAPGAPGPELVARITLEPAQDVKGYSVLVFLNAPQLTPDTPVTDPHHVGTITFFGSGHAGHGRERTFSLPLNMTLARLAAIGQPVTGAITLTMLAVDSSGQAKPFNAALTKVVIDQI